MATGLKQEILRKLIHLSSLWMPLSIGLFGSRMAFVLLGIALLAVVSFEIIRRTSHPLGKMLQQLFAPTLREFELSESPKCTGALYMLIGALLVTAIAPPATAIAALTVLMISDTLSALIGKRWGRTPLAGKSAEGTAAFFISAVLITFCVAPLSHHPLFLTGGIAASLVATMAELYARHLRADDNLLIPLCYALIQMLVFWCGGTI